MFASNLSFGQHLEVYRWKNRLLIISCENQNNEYHKKQLSLLSNQIKGLKERKLILFSFFDKGYRIGFSKKTLNYTEEKFKSPGEFSIQLIGLDGGVKLKKNTILNPEELFAIIDGIPMRRSELKSKRNE